MQKIVINRSLASFRLSWQAWCLYVKLAGLTVRYLVFTWADMEHTAEECWARTKPLDPDTTRQPASNMWDVILYTACDEGLTEHDLKRADPHLVKVVETLGNAAHGDEDGELKIVEVPDDVEWHLVTRDHDGCEYIAEKHRTWS